MQLLFILVPGKIFAIITALTRYRYLNLSYRLVLLQVFAAFICELFGAYLGYYLHENNLWLFNSYWLFELLIGSIIGFNLQKNTQSRKLIPPIALIAAVSWGINIFKAGFLSYATWAIATICVILVLIYLGVLFRVLFSSQNIFKQADFWLSVSILMFFGCNIPFYSLFNYLYSENPVLLDRLFDIVLVLNFIRYPLVAFSFYLHAKEASKPAQL
jgi:hypothetical protein